MTDWYMVFSMGYELVLTALTLFYAARFLWAEDDSVAGLRSGLIALYWFVLLLHWTQA